MKRNQPFEPHTLNQWLSLAIAFVALLHAPALRAAAPVITSFSPTSGTVGTSVTLSGTDLETATAVRFNGVNATFRSFGSFRATVPPNATTGRITVINPDGSGISATDFVVLPTPPPAINSFSPASGAPGISVLIQGTNLSGATAVRFNGVDASFVALDTEISASVPTNATSGLITVVTPGGSAVSSSAFSVTTAPPPVIQGFNPTSGPAGAQITINGQNFNNVTSVKFNGVNAVFAASSSQIVAFVPSGATTGPISVTTAAGTASSPGNFSVTAGAPPQISSFDPTSGSPGTVVSVTGSNFNGTTSVRFNGVEAPFLSISATEISATVPSQASSGPITVATLAGTNTSSANFTVTGPAPVIADFDPGFGAPGISIAISGQHFTTVTAVTFNGANATFTVSSTNQIIATVPAGVTTGPIAVTTANGTATSTQLFYGPARIVGFSPPNGIAGAQVTITGVNLTGTSAVRINEHEMPIVSVSNEEIRATVPEAARSGPLQVVTPAGTAASTNSFLVSPHIRNLSPSSGQPGTVVVITGSGLSGVNQVTFNGVPSASTTNVTAGEVHAVVPGNATTGPVAVQTAAGTAVTGEAFHVSLEILGFAPLSGVTGTDVTISGAAFVGVTSVAFNEVAAVFNVISPSAIRATVPVDASTGLIRVVSTNATVFSRDSFLVRPWVLAFSPQAGRPGDSIVISGTGFVGVTNVSFGTARASFQIDSPTRIRATVPDTASTGAINVISPAGNSISSNQFVVGVAADLAVGAIIIPTTPAPGATLTVTLTVTNLGPNTATNVVLTNLVGTTAASFFATNAHGSVTSSNNRAIFSLGNLTNGASASVSLGIVLAATESSYTNEAQITSALPDPDAANNVAVTSVNSVIQEPTLSARLLAGGSIEVSWPSSAVGFELEARNSLTTGAWAAAGGTPTQAGDRFFVVLPATDAARFFRLRRP